MAATAIPSLRGSLRGGNPAAVRQVAMLLRFRLSIISGGETSVGVLSAGLCAFLLTWMPLRATYAADKMSMTFSYINTPADRPSIAVVYKNTAADRSLM
jgi:RNA 3'-terminal phosphate cyclase